MCPILIRLGPLTLHTYGLMMAVGLATAYHLALRQMKRHGLEAKGVEPLFLWVVLAGLLGARLFYFAVEGFDELKKDPLSFFRIWEGGLVLYGSIIGGAIALALFSFSKKIPLLKLTDTLAAPLLLGQALGRLGCFAAGCCYGKPTSVAWGVTFRHPDSLAPLYVNLHPTQLYEFVGDMALLAGALILDRRRSARGFLTSYYFIGYGALRFVMEFLRGDDRGFLVAGLYPSQWLSMAAVLTGLGLYFYGTKIRRAG